MPTPQASSPQAGPTDASPPKAKPLDGSSLAERQEDVASGRPIGKGWKSFFAALQCSMAPLRSSDVGFLCSKNAVTLSIVMRLHCVTGLSVDST